MKTKKLQLLVIICLVSALTYGQTYSTGLFSIGSAIDGQIDINATSNSVTLTIIGPDDVYLAMGFDTEGHTSGKDVVIFDGSTLTDRRFSNSHSLPSLDAQQNWVLASNTASLGERTIVYTRDRDTGDANDYVFSSTPGTLAVVGSRGNGFTLNHHANRSATTVSFSSLGIDETDQISFSIAPNPVSSRLKVALPSNLNNGSIVIYDMLSRKIFTSEMNNAHTSIIDVSSWNSGIYLVKVSNGTSSQTKRFVKQ